MLVLGLNTAFSAMEAAIIRDGEILADARETMARGQDKALPGFVERLLDEAGVSLAELDRIAVVTGPGSFTGIRIGVAYARGLALVTEVPCIGVTSIEAAIPAGMEDTVLGCIAAQKRPPEQTWWVQGVSGNQGLAGTMEVGLDELKVMLTGFHGAHVTMGTIMLAAILGRAIKGHFTAKHHFGFEAVAWYWHFVDVVWLFLFVAIYVWGGWSAPVHGG